MYDLIFRALVMEESGGGLKSTYEVDAQSENLVWTTNMAHGRWYPTLVTLSDGKALVVNGLDEDGTPNQSTEIYDPSTKTWSQSYDPISILTYTVGKVQIGMCPGAGSPTYGARITE